jgi:acetoin utilization deacetylase AcuC-like enzyme
MSESPQEAEGIGSVPHEYYSRGQPLTGVVLLPHQERHDTGEHPENARRLPQVLEHLRSKRAEWERMFVLYPRYARTEDVLRSHDPGYLELLEASCADAPLWLDTDTRVSQGSFSNAMLASGAALTAVDAVVMEAYHRPDSLLTLTRPPGHHAGRDRAMGFCLLNHASIAARYAQAQYGLERVAILDWDVHHGNGTQEIHWEDPSVLTISLHQWPLYPGTGWVDEVGGEGAEGRTVNIPLPPGSRDEEYLQALDRVALPILGAYRPQLLIVSAGQDCHAADPLANQLVSTAGLRAMAARAAAFARGLGIGLVLVHEGGYNVSTLPQLVCSILGGLGDLPSDDDDPFVPPRAPVPAQWAERLQQVLEIQSVHWPECSSES